MTCKYLSWRPEDENEDGKKQQTKKNTKHYKKFREVIPDCVGGLLDIGPNWMLRIKDTLFCHFDYVCIEAD